MLVLALETSNLDLVVSVANICPALLSVLVMRFLQAATSKIEEHERSTAFENLHPDANVRLLHFFRSARLPIRRVRPESDLPVMEVDFHIIQHVVYMSMNE